MKTVSFRHGAERLIRFDSPEPEVGAYVARYGIVWRRFKKGWRRVGYVDEHSKVADLGAPRGKYTSWAALFDVDGSSDWVVGEDKSEGAT